MLDWLPEGNYVARDYTPNVPEWELECLSKPRSDALKPLVFLSPTPVLIRTLRVRSEIKA